MTPATLAATRSQLTDREVAIARDLARLRLACGKQIERLHFTTEATAANARHCRRVLGKLTDLGVVSRFDRRVGGVRAGSAGYVYALGVVGQHLASSAGPAGGQIRRPWTPGSAFLRHRLATSEIYVQLVEAGRRGQAELVAFQSEPDTWRRYSAHAGRATLKPDAYAVVAAGDYEHVWFIEVDLGTESPATLGRKCRAYCQYRVSGREQATSGLFPLVLFLTPSAARCRTIEAVIASRAPDDQRLFRVGRLDEPARLLAGGAA